MNLLPIVLGATFAAAITSFGIALLLMRGARHLGLVDPPGGRKLQRHAVPLVGGALLAGVLVGGVAGTRVGGLPLEFADLLALAVPLLCFVVGVVDDARLTGLTPGVKAFATLLAFLPAMRGDAGWASVFEPRTLLAAAAAFAALHATNTIDHANGLCGLVAAIGAGCAAAAALGAEHGAAALFAGLVGGSSVGFLALNYPAGRVFLGDSGSLLLGGCFATALIGSGRVEWLLLAAVPLADLASVALLRLRAGVAPWQGDRRHATHRLQALGMREPVAVLLLAVVQLLCSLLAVPRLFTPARPGAVTLVMGVIGVLAVGMLFIPLPRDAEPAAGEAGAR